MKKLSVLFMLLLSIIFLSLAESQAAGTKYVASKSGLNLRANPDKASKVITLIPFGEKIDVIKDQGKEIFMDGRHGKWTNVKYADKTGWVFSGFLCSFDPGAIIKPAAEYYRKEYIKYSYYSEEYTTFKDSAVSVQYVVDNFIILRIPTTSRLDPEFSSGDVVWKYDAVLNQFAEVYNSGPENSFELLYIDNDRFPDLVYDDGCCNSTQMHILLGSESGFTEVYEMKDECSSEEIFHYEAGSCASMIMICDHSRCESKTVKVKDESFKEYKCTSILRHFSFNCETRKFEEQSANEIFYSAGIVKSINLKDRTIVINDDNDLKDKSYPLVNYTSFRSDDPDHYGDRIEDLKAGTYIRYAYESPGGKNTVFRIISEGDKTGYIIKGWVAAIDTSAGLLALKFDNSTNVNVYNIPENVEMKNKTRSINDLQVNEEIELFFDRGRMVAIDTKVNVLGGENNSGVINSLNYEKRMISIKKDDSSEEVFYLSQNAVIKIDNKTIKDISRLKKGQRIKIRYEKLDLFNYISTLEVIGD